MDELIERASIVAFASHSLDVMPTFCDRTVLLKHGRTVADGPTPEVVCLYVAGAGEASP